MGVVSTILNRLTEGARASRPGHARRRTGLLAAAVIAGALAPTAGVVAQSTYVGSNACKECHEQKWNDHRVSGHPHVQRKIEGDDGWPLGLPDGCDWDDVSYVIGGFKWKATFLNTDGYIITSTPGATGKNQFNLATGEWVDYAAGELAPYDCGECHTTGYSPAGNQDGLPGVVGTWVFEGIQCERCHGPGSAHVAQPSALNITVNDNSCQTCHSRGDPQKIPASGGFVREHQQYNELLASPHFFLDCATCHDPHKKAEFSIRLECTTCHSDMAKPKDAFEKLGRRHAARGVDCVDCHMPHAAKAAVSFNKYKADLRSHQFRVNLAEDAAMFDPDGSVANGALTAAYVCLGCHEHIVDKFAAAGEPKKAEAWARKRAKKIHKD